jgi:hypothetical protein
MKLAFITVALALASLTATAQEIKGIALGMTKEAFQTAFPDSKPATGPGDKRFIPMTVAGVSSKYASGAMVEFDEDKLVGFIFFFDSKEFNSVQDEFKDKYPELTCSDSTVTNRMGAQFTDTKCIYKSLRIGRFSGDLNTSAIGMTDPEFLAKKSAARTKKASGDL